MPRGTAVALWDSRECEFIPSRRGIECEQSLAGHDFGKPGIEFGAGFPKKRNLTRRGAGRTAADHQSLSEKPRQHQHSLPNKPVSHIDLTQNPDLGNRKRTIRDEIKAPLKAPPDLHSIGGKKKPASGEIVMAWKVQLGVPPTPWISADHSDSANMGVW